MGSNNPYYRVSFRVDSVPNPLRLHQNLELKFVIHERTTFRSVTETGDIRLADYMAVSSTVTAASSTRDLGTIRSAYLFVSDKLQHAHIPSHIKHNVYLDITRRVCAEARWFHESDVKLQLYVDVDIEGEGELIAAETENEGLLRELEASAQEDHRTPRSVDIEGEGELIVAETENEGLLRVLEASRQEDHRPPRPASRVAVESLARVDIGAQEEVLCTICIVEINADARALPCSHKYHESCILKWLELSNSCPICRYQLPED
ncbi:E3 ubiquitin-protein ligase SDIR1 [Amborella trichopoda]|uniref:RING-type domain-containing protein n=1 Tax=Amborella trichopoda TaxID=13333 RepID=W1NRW7_AMBTC|nr:E3 ubiquitin-protein ligase SDIR1 [Amborella trichopoda]ERM99716.1 hypothetical protein AMTR_s00099p00094240 [Amborella trichopoda]|eukprot:XP_006836863.1 E3 ubiquitin-protein ligase SDIR1 [Amborella trichopoda]